MAAQAPVDEIAQLSGKLNLHRETVKAWQQLIG